MTSPRSAHVRRPDVRELSDAPTIRSGTPDGRSGPAVRAAFGRLTAVLTDVAATADRSLRRRCPHRGVKSRCHYRAACRNQVTANGSAVCGGDASIRFEPMTEDSPTEGPTALAPE